MSMALALAKAMEEKEEAVMEIPITETLAKKINISSGEDVGFDLDEEEAWAWRAHEQSLNLGNYSGD